MSPLNTLMCLISGALVGGWLPDLSLFLAVSRGHFGSRMGPWAESCCAQQVVSWACASLHTQVLFACVGGLHTWVPTKITGNTAGNPGVLGC